MRLLTLALALTLVSSEAFAAKPEAVAALQEGRRLLEAKKTPAAIQAYLRATELDPSYGEAWTELGNAYLMSGNSAEAATAFTGALKVDAGNSTARYNLAYSLRKTKQYAEAARQYRTYLETNPNDADAHYGLAESLRSSGDALGAADAYDAYARVEKRPKQQKWVQKAKQRAAELRAEAAAKAPAPAPAKPAPKAAVADKPAKLEMSVSGAAAKPDVMPSKEAAAAEAPARGGQRTDAFTAGLDHLQRGDYVAAKERLAVALREQPEDPIVLAAQGSTFLGLLDGVGAESAYKKALVMAPDAAVPGIYLGLGEAQRIQGKLAEAAASYRRASAHQRASNSVKRFSEERLAAVQ
ncbi:MAG: tetratricopeptide repeat protein [Deltaproteobacteria bacterium]